MTESPNLAGFVWGFFAGCFAMSAYFYLPRTRDRAVVVVSVAAALVALVAIDAHAAKKPPIDRAERHAREAKTEFCIKSCRAECSMSCVRGSGK